MSLTPAKTGIPNIVNSKLFTTVDFHISATNFSGIIDNYKDYVAACKLYRTTKFNSDPITAEAEFWEDLTKASLDLSKVSKTSSGGFDIGSDEGGEFIAWWLDEYRRTHFKVKEILESKINIEDTILQEFSESVGFLFFQHQFPDSRYTHYADDDGDPTPIPYNSIIDDKLEFETRTNIIGLNKRVDAIFKRNMQQVINTTDVSTDAHRENLVTDHLHYKRLKENQPEINENIGNTLGDAYKVLLWLSSAKLNDKQVNVPAVITTTIEGDQEAIDILGNKIKYNTPLTTDTLTSG
tara:strand:- start:537 stop:1421 length:885 start_codon:yes stop_codon:yes gene_type:complete